jgi:elongation factor P hydroxylase
MRGAGSFIRGAIIFGGSAVLALAVFNTNLSGQSHLFGQSSAFQAGIRTHASRTETQPTLEFPEVGETPAQVEFEMPPPTRSSFMARWDRVIGATGYLLDVSTSDSFISYVDGYHDLDVGNVTGRAITGFSRGTTYYYRARAYNANGPGRYSDVMTVTTVATVGLIIHPTFDGSVTGNPNAAAIEAMINRAISIYESLFSDPITIQIFFRYSPNAPDGTPLTANEISQSDYVYYTIPWNTYINALRADAKTGNDNLANSTLPGTALSPNVNVSSAAGRAIGLDTPPGISAHGTPGGPYDGIVTLNSTVPWLFNRPVSAGHFDAQRSTEHEMDENLGFASHLGANNQTNLWPQDLFSWSSAGHRNVSSSGSRYFSINGGSTNIVNFNQNPNADFGDWLSGACPQAHPYVQNAYGCTGQSSDVTAISPEGINLDVIGYDLVNGPPPAPAEYDFNGDGRPDYLLYNFSTQQTLIGYLYNNVLIGAAFGPTLPVGWQVVTAEDFNLDGHPDYVLFNASTLQTVIWYMNNNVVFTGAYGPTLPAGWSVVAVADFNGDGHPDYLLFNASTLQTVIWYMNNNVVFTGAYGPTLPAGWSVVGAADFNADGKPDYLLFNASTLQTVIWYMNNNVVFTGAYGPTLPAGWSLVAP